jgi:hypothetical protein
VFVLLLLLYCFIFILVLLLCCVSRSSFYCNINSDLCTLCLSCYYFYIVLSLYSIEYTILYPELSFLLRYTPSLSTPILQDCVKFRNSKKNVLKIGLIIVNYSLKNAFPPLLGELLCGGKN